jgi:chromate transporter
VYLKLPFPLIVMMAGALGWLLRGRLLVTRGQGSVTLTGHKPAWIGDDTPIPDHALFSRVRLIKIITIGVSLWGLALLLVMQADDTLAQMAIFFSKAALVTFGGAYAVMPYVFQATVEQYQWLTPAQMLDGLALGETTPGR